jgi:hypothetical protein
MHTPHGVCIAEPYILGCLPTSRITRQSRAYPRDRPRHSDGPDLGTTWICCTVLAGVHEKKPSQSSGVFDSNRPSRMRQKMVSMQGETPHAGWVSHSARHISRYCSPWFMACSRGGIHPARYHDRTDSESSFQGALGAWASMQGTQLLNECLGITDHSQSQISDIRPHVSMR